MNEEIQEQLEQLRVGVVTRNADVVEDVIGQLEFFICDDVWPDELFDAMKRLLLDADFLAIPTSVGMVRLIQGNWDELSPAQRAELRPVLAGAFDKFGDWLGTFIVAEIFGDRYADAAGLVTLGQLSSSAATRPSRALAAYGLGRLARSLGEGPVYTRAVERLKVLADSATPEIRKEAREALEKLGNERR